MTRRIYKYEIAKRDISQLLLPYGAKITGLGVQVEDEKSLPIFEVSFEGVADARMTFAVATDTDARDYAMRFMPTATVKSIRQIRREDDGQRICLWAEVDPTAQPVPVTIWSVPTGADVPMCEIERLTRLGMVTLAGKSGPGVFHIYADLRLVAGNR